MPAPDDDITAFQNSLLNWAEKEGRVYPWRSASSAYEILVAEKLLQQTSAREHVVRAYQQILEAFPSVHQLAQAPLEELTKIIQPLGFVYRARELIVLAQSLLQYHNGHIPDSLATLLSLPGVGDYAARAILSFAFNKDYAVVDTNVARLLYRLYNRLNRQ